MVTAILERSANYFNNHILSPLTLNTNPVERITEMARRLNNYYQNGFGSCLLETLSIDQSQEEFKEHIKNSFITWCNALLQVANESGFSNDEARLRAEQALVNIEGGLVFARITGNNKPFQNSLAELPVLLTGKVS